MTTVLRYLRDTEGWAFDAAWAKALGSLPRPPRDAPPEERADHRDWLAVLRMCRPVFEDAYHLRTLGFEQLPDVASDLGVQDPQAVAA